MYLIGPKVEYSDKERYVFDLNDKSYLLINQSSKYFLIENKCGHFGISLFDAELKKNTIICSGHGISFDLTSGQIINRPYEICDKLTTFKVIEFDGLLYFTDNI